MANPPRGWDGHIHPSWDPRCRNCDAPLSGADGPRPAETYLGTYNGLCYPCTLSGMRLERLRSDGLREYSFPPYLSSWRRDRQTVLVRPYCVECGGSPTYGRERLRHGVSYRQCWTCLRGRTDRSRVRTSMARLRLLAQVPDGASTRKLGSVNVYKRRCDECDEENTWRRVVCEHPKPVAVEYPEAWETPTPGLVVAKAPKPAKGWNILLVPAGVLLGGGYRTKADAARLAAALNSLAPDLTRDAETLLAESASRIASAWTYVRAATNPSGATWRSSSHRRVADGFQPWTPGSIARQEGKYLLAEEAA